MNNGFARHIIEKIIQHIAVMIVEYHETNDEKGEEECIEAMDALHLALEEMEQNEKFREAIDEFCL